MAMVAKKLIVNKRILTDLLTPVFFLFAGCFEKAKEELSSASRTYCQDEFQRHRQSTKLGISDRL